MNSIRTKLVIQFLASNTNTLVSFLLSIVLARLLTPAEIGIFSITAVTVGFAHVFRDFGVGSYIRRQKDLTPEILRAAMGVLVTSSWSIAICLYLASGHIATYFGQVGIQSVMHVLAIGFLFIPIGAIPQAVLSRDLQAEKQAVVTLTSAAVYATTCITLALAGFSYMSMAWANLVNIIATGIGFTLVRPTGMPWLPSFRGWRKVANFGAGAILTNSLKAIDNALPDMFLGRLSGPHLVGLYSRANSTVNIVNYVSGPTINYVALPHLARIHHAGDDVSRDVGRGIALLTGLLWPALAATSLFSAEIVEFLYGRAWLDCVPAILWLAMAAATQASFSMLQPALTGIGRPYWTALPFFLSIGAKLAIAITIFDGSIESFARAVAIAEFATVPAYLMLSGRFVGMSISRWIRSLFPSFVVALVTWGALWAMQPLTHGVDSNAARLLIALLIGLPTWTLLVFLVRHPWREELTRLARWLSTKLRARNDGADATPPAAPSPATATNIVIYGTIARPLSGPLNREGRLARLKRQLKTIRDLWLRRGNAGFIDYRDYDSPHSSNVGDIAIAESARRQLRQRFPDARFIDLNWGELAALLHLPQPDLIVVAGSGYFSFAKTGRLVARLEQDLEVLTKISAPLVFYGIGVNRSLGSDSNQSELSIQPEDRRLAARLLDRASLVSVRDGASRTVLQSMTEKPIDLIGDPALFLATLQSPNDLRERDAESGERPAIGINFAFHGPLSNQLLRKNIGAYVDLLKGLKQRTNCDFHYFVHHASERIIPRLLAQKGIRTTVVHGSPDQLSLAYANMDLHIGGMLHSCILATGADVPCIALAYDVKHYGFFELMDMKSRCFSAHHFGAEGVLSAALTALADGSALRQRIRARRQELASRNAAFLAACTSLLRDRDQSNELLVGAQ